MMWHRKKYSLKYRFISADHLKRMILIGVITGSILISACGQQTLSEETLVSTVTETPGESEEKAGQMEEESDDYSESEETSDEVGSEQTASDEVALEGNESAEATLTGEENDESLNGNMSESVIEFQGRLYSTSTKLLAFETVPFPEEIEVLKLFPELEKVDLCSTRVNETRLAAIQEALPGVEIVHLISLDEIGKAYENMIIRTDEKELDFSKKRVTNIDALRGFLDQMTSLEKLILCDTGLKTEEIAPLRDEYPDTKFVWTMYIGPHRLRTDDVAFSTFSKIGDTYSFTSENCELFQYCTDLRALDLGHQSIQDLSWLRYLPDLRILILADTNIEDITEIGNLHELRYLELFIDYRITDWSPLANCTKMEDLNICYVHCTEDYSYLYSMPNLKRFWAKMAYSWETIKEIKEILPPECIFNYEGGDGSTDCGWRWDERYAAMRNCFFYNCLDPLYE